MQIHIMPKSFSKSGATFVFDEVPAEVELGQAARMTRQRLRKVFKRLACYIVIEKVKFDQASVSFQAL